MPVVSVSPSDQRDRVVKNIFRAAAWSDSAASLRRCWSVSGSRRSAADGDRRDRSLVEADDVAVMNSVERMERSSGWSEVALIALAGRRRRTRSKWRWVAGPGRAPAPRSARARRPRHVRGTRFPARRSGARLSSGAGAALPSGRVAIGGAQQQRRSGGVGWPGRRRRRSILTAPRGPSRSAVSFKCGGPSAPVKWGEPGGRAWWQREPPRRLSAAPGPTVQSPGTGGIFVSGRPEAASPSAGSSARGGLRGARPGRVDAMPA